LEEVVVVMVVVVEVVVMVVVVMVVVVMVDIIQDQDPIIVVITVVIMEVVGVVTMDIGRGIGRSGIVHIGTGFIGLLITYFIRLIMFILSKIQKIPHFGNNDGLEY
jgi:hypothetical protein